MKRDVHLQPLSRQHHNALMAVLLLKKGVQKQADVTVMKDFILFIWENELVHHFEAEEQWLSTPDAFIELKVMYERMLKEHMHIRSLIEQFKTNNCSADTVELFYNVLEQHVRFEEREFFPAIEHNLPVEELEKIGAHINDTDGPGCTNYPLKFWE